MERENTYRRKVHFETKNHSILDKSTGEITDRKLIERIISPDYIDIGFVKLWRSYLIEFLKGCNKQDCKILAFLLAYANKRNCIELTQRELSKNIGLSLPTVNRSMSYLKSLNIIRSSRKLIMFNPDFIAYGRPKTRSELIEIYERL